MKKSCQFSLAVSALASLLITGCESIDTSVFGGSFGRNSTAMTAGGAVAGQDYVIGLKPSEAAQQYFASASASDAKTVTVTPGDDKGTGVTWTDDGGITIPPGVTIEFTNKGCCLDPHLPAPKADEEMQFIKTSCLIPTQLQGTYKNLLRRAAAGDEDVKSNLQHLMWTLRTAGSNDAYAKNLTDRQREILAECAEAGSFDGYCQDLHRYDELKKLVMAQVGQVTDKLQVEIGNVTYKVSDLLDPELGKQKVAAHLGELIHMNEYLPVVHSGFNYGELQKGIYTDIKGNGTLSFKAKIANSTSEPFVFYPMDYVAQVGSGQDMQGAFFAAADSTMRQRTTITMPVSMDIIIGQISSMQCANTEVYLQRDSKNDLKLGSKIDTPSALKKIEKEVKSHVGFLGYFGGKKKYEKYEYAGYIWRDSKGDLRLTDLGQVGKCGGTLNYDDKNFIYGFHTHPGKDASVNLFSYHDCKKVMDTGKTEIIYVVETGKFHALNLEDIPQSVREEINEMSTKANWDELGHSKGWPGRDL